MSVSPFRYTLHMTQAIDSFSVSCALVDIHRWIIRSGHANVVVKRDRVVQLCPGDWFGEEVFQQAVQIERRRSTFVSGELTKRLQALNLAKALQVAGNTDGAPDATTQRIDNRPFPTALTGSDGFISLSVQTVPSTTGTISSGQQNESASALARRNKKILTLDSIGTLDEEPCLPYTSVDRLKLESWFFIHSIEFQTRQ